MLIEIDQDKETNRDKVPEKLATEGPLTEKDQQGQAIERQQKEAAKALSKWQHLKNKITHPLKK